MVEILLFQMPTEGNPTTLRESFTSEHVPLAGALGAMEELMRGMYSCSFWCSCGGDEAIICVADKVVSDHTLGLWGTTKKK